MHEKMPLIFKWSTTSGWFLWSIWTSSQCEHWIAACDAFTLSTKVTFDHISIMAEFGPPVWRLTIRLITELYVQIAKASYYKSLVWTVTVNKQRHGAGTKAWCFTLFEFQVWTGKPVDLIQIFKTELCPSISNNISEEHLQTNLVSVFTRTAKI